MQPNACGGCGARAFDWDTPNGVHLRYCRLCYRYYCTSHCFGGKYCVRCESRQEDRRRARERARALGAYLRGEVRPRIVWPKEIEEDKEDDMGLKPRNLASRKLATPVVTHPAHKLIARDGTAACGAIDYMERKANHAGEVSPQQLEASIYATDTWLHIRCADCLRTKPATVHAVANPGADVPWEPSEARWKERAALCGAPLSPADSAISTSQTQHSGLSCLACMDTIPAEHRQHRGVDGGSTKATVCGTKPSPQCPWPSKDWTGVNCADCFRVAERQEVPGFVEQSAAITVHNALAWARRKGLEIVASSCSYCNGKSDGSICCVCAPVVARDRFRKDHDADAACAALLGVPIQWLIDFATGFDGDGKAQLYQSAFAMGRKLARKFGVKRKPAAEASA